MARRTRRKRARRGVRQTHPQFVELLAPRPVRELVLEGGDARGTWVRLLWRDGGARGA